MLIYLGLVIIAFSINKNKYYFQPEVLSYIN